MILFLPILSTPLRFTLLLMTYLGVVRCELVTDSEFSPIEKMFIAIIPFQFSFDVFRITWATKMWA